MTMNMKSNTSFTKTKSRKVMMVVFPATVCALLLVGCMSMAQPHVYDAEEPDALTVAWSHWTPNLGAGSVAMFEYSGPPFDKQEYLEVVVGDGGDEIPWKYIDPWITVLLPQSQEGVTGVTFDFGGATSPVTILLDIAGVPSISDPRQYVADEFAKLATSVGGLVTLDVEFQAVQDELVAMQSVLADPANHDDDEIAELAVFMKQNIEPNLVPVHESESDDECRSAAKYLEDMSHATVASSGALSAYTELPVVHGVGLAAGVGAVFIAGDGTAVAAHRVLEECTRSVVDEVATVAGSLVYSMEESELSEIRFDDGESTDFTITLKSHIRNDYKDLIYYNIGSVLWLIKGARFYLSSHHERLNASFDALLARYPEEPKELRKTAVARGFTLEGPADGNITGEIVGAQGERLALRFSFNDRSLVEGAEYVDFDFTLANEAERLDDTVIPARLYLESE